MTAYYEEMIQEIREKIETNLPPALELAGVPKEEHRFVIDRVLGRLPSSTYAEDGQGLDPALVVGLGLLDVRRRDKGIEIEPVSGNVRKEFLRIAFADYLWEEPDWIDAEFEELKEAHDLVLVAHDIGSDVRKHGLAALSTQIDAFNKTVRSPLITKARALCAYRALANGKTASAVGARLSIIA